MEDFLAEYGNRDIMRASAAYTKRHARTFYFASFLLPKEKREAAYVVYSFCRYADNILDDAGEGDPPLRLAKLDRLRSELEKIYSGSGSVDLKLTAFRGVVRRFEIPLEPLVAIIEGVAMDFKIVRYATWEELEVYCYRVAAAVGLVMAHIFGVASEQAYEHAVELGKAMQLTNILRDVKEDFDRGRVYLPLEEIERFGCSEEVIEQGRVTLDFVELMKFEISRARSFYRQADRGIPLVTDDGSRFCVRAMSSLYERILDVIERNGYDVFRRRLAVSFMEKVAQLIKLRTQPPLWPMAGAKV